MILFSISLYEYCFKYVNIDSYERDMHCAYIHSIMQLRTLHFLLPIPSIIYIVTFNVIYYAVLTGNYFVNKPLLNTIHLSVKATCTESGFFLRFN